MKNVIGFIFVCLGLALLFLGEPVVLAWCIYDFVQLVKGTVTFGACLWLVFLYFFRAVLIVAVGAPMIFVGGILLDERL